jgi:hypothetical protein
MPLSALALPAMWLSSATITLRELRQILIVILAFEMRIPLAHVAAESWRRRWAKSAWRIGGTWRKPATTIGTGSNAGCNFSSKRQYRSEPTLFSVQTPT